MSGDYEALEFFLPMRSLVAWAESHTQVAQWKGQSPAVEGENLKGQRVALRGESLALKSQSLALRRENHALKVLLGLILNRYT